MARRLSRIFVLACLTALAISRASLLVHELVGHGAVAQAIGAKVVGWYLFLFGGGRVSYDTSTLGVGPRLVIALGGITLELVLGGAALALWRRPRSSLARFAVFAFGASNVVHGLVYLARGTHYAYGDGALLARTLGASRWPIVALASVAAIVAIGLSARDLGAQLATWLDLPRVRLAGAALAIVLGAGLVHGALAQAELRFFPDPAYVRTMENESRARARAELAAQLEAARRRGEAPPTPDQEKAMLEALERERRPWPLDLVLLPAMLVALGIGLSRGTRRDPPRAGETETSAAAPDWRSVATMGLVLGGLFALILVLRAFGGR